MSRGFKEEGSIGEGNGGEVSEADFLRIKKQKINRLTDRQEQQNPSDKRQRIKKFDNQLDNLLAEYERELEARKRGEQQKRSLEEQNSQTVEQVKELLEKAGRDVEGPQKRKRLTDRQEQQNPSDKRQKMSGFDEQLSDLRAGYMRERETRERGETPQERETLTDRQEQQNSPDQRQRIKEFDKQLDNLRAGYVKEREARERGEPQKRLWVEQNSQAVEQVKGLLREVRGEVGGPQRRKRLTDRQKQQRQPDQRQSIEKFDKQLDNLLAEYERELEARKRGEPQKRSLEEQNLQTVEQVKELLRGMRSGGEMQETSWDLHLKAAKQIKEEMRRAPRREKMDQEFRARAALEDREEARIQEERRMQLVERGKQFHERGRQLEKRGLPLFQRLMNLRQQEVSPQQEEGLQQLDKEMQQLDKDVQQLDKEMQPWREEMQQFRRVQQVLKMWQLGREMRRLPERQEQERQRELPGQQEQE